MCIRDSFYSHQHPGPEDILLLIEVSDTTLPYDRRVKAELYSAAGVLEYWIINLPKRVIEVYREPQPVSYTHLHPQIRQIGQISEPNNTF